MLIVSCHDCAVVNIGVGSKVRRADSIPSPAHFDRHVCLWDCLVMKVNFVFWILLLFQAMRRQWRRVKLKRLLLPLFCWGYVMYDLVHLTVDLT